MAREYQTSSLSRERNRIHARKTRQRKKEQMQSLQSRAEELKADQIGLKQQINEKNTANILVGLVSIGKRALPSRPVDPVIEELLRRPMEEIPDPSKLPELPALVLPGHHTGKASGAAAAYPDDGIDYELLGKDRSKCTSAELDQIRRERNRMHAKRTRDRKRLYMEEMGEMCKKLESENALLTRHLEGLASGPSDRLTPDGAHRLSDSALVAPVGSVGAVSTNISLFARPDLAPAPCPMPPPAEVRFQLTPPANQIASTRVSRHGVTLDQINTLLRAAEAFPDASAVSHSACSSEDGNSSDNTETRSSKRLRLSESPGERSPAGPSPLPRSITTSSQNPETIDLL